MDMEGLTGQHENQDDEAISLRALGTDTESTQSACAQGDVSVSLRDEAQCLINEINEKRKQDVTLLTDIRKQLDLQVEKTCNSVEKHMYQVYGNQGKVMQDKLDELFATLDRISKLEAELDEFKHVLGSLYQEVS